MTATTYYCLSGRDMRLPPPPPPQPPPPPTHTLTHTYPHTRTCLCPIKKEGNKSTASIIPHDSNYLVRKGNIIEEFITKNDLCITNDKSYTYLHPATGKFSSLDLSLCHPSLLLDFDWTVSEDQHGSDHFPVIIESVNASTSDHNAK